MGRLVGNDPLKRIRHPIAKNPHPGPSIFVDAKDKDLPYDGQCKHAVLSIFDHPLGLKQEGALLMAILTGTQESALQKVVKGTAEKNLYSKIGDGETSTSDHSTGHRGVEVKIKKSVIKKLFFGSALGRKKRKSSVSLQLHPHQRAGRQHTHIAGVAVASDTCDLEELTGDENIPENELHEEELDKETSVPEAGTVDEKNMPIDEYLKMVKKSTGRISYRTKLLDELALGEDIDMWVKDSEFPLIPPPPSSQKSKETKDGDPEQPIKETKPTDPGAKTSPEYKGAMRATSLVVKKARRLAGLMHIEQQNNDLKDVCTWLQHLGTVSVCQPARMDDYATIQPQGGITGDVAATKADGQKGDWRLPTSPAAALLMAQEDLRQRLAQLYEEKSLMETRKDQLDAAKKLVGRKLSGDGEEDSYEVLGGKISENLDDADKLEKKYWKLNEKAKEEEEMKAQKGKKGSKGKKDATNVKKDKSSGETDLDEDGTNEGRGKKSRKRRKKVGKDEFAEADVFYGTSEGDETEEGSKTSNRGKTRKPTKQALDSEAEKDEDVGTSMQGEDDTDSGGKKERKRVKVKGTKAEDLVELPGPDGAIVQTKKGQNVQVGKDAMAISSGEASGTDSDISTKGAKGKEKQSPDEQKAQPQPGSQPSASPILESQGQSSSQSQLSTGDGQNENDNNATVPTGAQSVSAATGEDLRSQDAARLNRQRTSTGTQAKGIQTGTQQKDFDTDIHEEFEIVNGVVRKPRVSSQDEAIQTDDAVLFSLMESMIEAMPNDEQPSNTEDEAGEIKRLRREVKKAQMQLRFWRSRNWVEKHSRLSPSGRGSHPVIDSPSEAGFSFYFNAVKSPRLVAHGPSQGPVPYPMTHPSGMTGTADYATPPLRARGPHQVEAPRPPQASNVKTLSSTSLATHTRLARSSRRTSSEFQSLTTGTGLVIFGRSTTLVMPHSEGNSIAHLPTHENRVSRLSPRMSGTQYQKA